MEKESMRVSEIIAVYEKARRDNRIPYKPRNNDFKKIFDQKCKEIKDGQIFSYSKN